MKSFFDDNVTGLVISLLQFDKVLAEHAPDISAHLVCDADWIEKEEEDEEEGVVSLIFVLICRASS